MADIQSGKVASFHKNIEKVLIQELRDFLELEPKYPDSFLVMNLFSYMIQDEKKVFQWIEHIQDRFQIVIPDSACDLFFLTDISVMAKVVSEQLNSIK